MDAIALAGGYATRLWPVTRHRPKMLLPVGDTTVIDRTLSSLEDDERIDDVYVSTNERFADSFEEFIAERDYEKPRLSVEETTEEDEKFGVVGALAQLIDREGLDDDLLVVAGDNMMGFEIGDFVDYFEEKSAPVLAAYDVGSRERAKSYGLIQLDGDRVVDFQEKPDDPNSTLVSVACYAFPEETLGLFDTYLENGENPDEPGWFVQWLQARRAVYAYTFDDTWFDIGTRESYLDAVEHELGGEPRIHPEATVENSNLHGAVHVMEGAEIRDATLEDVVVFPNAQIEEAAVSNSILDEHAEVEGIDLSGSLVGAHSSLLAEQALVELPADD